MNNRRSVADIISSGGPIFKEEAENKKKLEEDRNRLQQALSKFSPMMREYNIRGISCLHKHIAKIEAVLEFAHERLVEYNIHELDEMSTLQYFEDVYSVLELYSTSRSPTIWCFFYNFMRHIDRVYFSYNEKITPEDPLYDDEYDTVIQNLNKNLRWAEEHSLPRLDVKRAAVERTIKMLNETTMVKRPLRGVAEVEIPDDYICCICHCEKEDLNEDDDVKVVESMCCKHQACQGCFNQWKGVKSSCFACRSPI